MTPFSELVPTHDKSARQPIWTHAVRPKGERQGRRESIRTAKRSKPSCRPRFPVVSWYKKKEPSNDSLFRIGADTRQIGTIADLDARSAPEGRAPGTARVNSNREAVEAVVSAALSGGVLIQKKEPSNDSFFRIGADTRIRTADLLITNQLLCQLSYAGLFVCLSGLSPEAAHYSRLQAFRQAARGSIR